MMERVAHIWLMGLRMAMGSTNGRTSKEHGWPIHDGSYGGIPSILLFIARALGSYEDVEFLFSSLVGTGHVVTVVYAEAWF